eukprot:CAMPEP_0176014066 /NCGR_PEP_ID=MMETSP0120_2-20121206/6628_1 /TAXON_ID=160619 /ORGANISM="Kryptoperidinium foliaceum, Strain CCMP 1326" /LENGTH=214 /DNA_ID=CAMNT_0017346989 /DNA_START=163 /DNA_END=807 /DNA_ORIENTATION=-
MDSASFGNCNMVSKEEAPDNRLPTTRKEQVVAATTDQNSSSGAIDNRHVTVAKKPDNMSVLDHETDSLSSYSRLSSNEDRDEEASLASIIKSEDVAEMPANVTPSRCIAPPPVVKREEEEEVDDDDDGCGDMLQEETGGPGQTVPPIVLPHATSCLNHKQRVDRLEASSGIGNGLGTLIQRLRQLEESLEIDGAGKRFAQRLLELEKEFNIEQD